jgi:hypothetical protein
MEVAATPPSFVLDHYESTHDECDIVIGYGSTRAGFGNVRVPNDIRTQISTVIFSRRATWASVETMTRVLTLSLATRRKAGVPFDS